MASRHYRFAPFELDALARELREGNRPVALPLKSFDCLVYLIEHRDRAVGRDELISAVWGRADVSDALLGQTLARARRAIGDTGDVQGAIRTVPRFGYHWVKPIDVVEAVPTVSPAKPDVDVVQAAPEARSSSTPPSHASRRYPAILLLALLALGVAVALVVIDRRRDAMPTAVVVPPDLVLVLPVAVSDADPRSRWLRFGAMDYLASRVRERAHVPVLPTEQTIAFIGDRSAAVLADPAERSRLARDVGASRIIASRISHEAGSWSFVLDVQDAEKTTTFRGVADTPLQAADVALGEFFVRSGIGDPAEPLQRPTLIELQQRIDAAFLDGDLEQAAETIESAPLDLQKDPAIVVRGAEIDERAGREEPAQRGFATLADNAENVPPDVLARARYGLCTLAFQRNDLASAGQLCRDSLAALADHPDPMLLGRAHMLSAVIDEKSGRFDTAMAGFGLARIEWRRAGNLPGEASVDGNEAMAESRRGRFAEAIAAFDRAIAVFARFGVQDHMASTLSAKSDTQRMMLDFDDALATSAQAWQMTPRIGNEMTVRAIAYSQLLALLVNGRLDEAGRLLDRFDAGIDAPPEFVVLRRQWLAEQGRYSEAIVGADALIDSLMTPGAPSGDERLSGTVDLLVDAALGAGDTRLAIHLLKRLQDAGAQPEDADRSFVIALSAARIAAATGDTGAADAHFDSALASALGINRPDQIVAAGSPYLLYLLSGRRMEDAKRVAGRLALFADKDYAAARAMVKFHEQVGDRRSAETLQARIPQLAGQRAHVLTPLH
ncbi:MAG: winged helix-turn-helix domain-containing protein [Dokdonella sp.]|uniref:winged helix-turn-helix domain-containing protein n=1 Tax=Dokdonella sp. TaxID=2291710 RepID=UPI00326417B2